MQNKKIGLRKEKIELISLIKTCSNYKKQIISYEKQLQRYYDNNLIDKREYEEKLGIALKDRTVRQWLQYYDNCILSYRNKIIEIDREIREAEKRNLLLPLLTMIIFIGLIGASYYFIQPQITGLTVVENISNASVSENITNITEIFTIPLANISTNLSVENITEIVLPVENISNETLIVPITNISEVTEVDENITKETEELLEWNYTKVPKEKSGKIKDGEVYFDGKNDYEIINSSENILIINRTLRIETIVKIDEMTKGVIVSKYDYPNVTNIELAVDVTGSVKLNLFDVSFSTILETNKTYNDNKYHEIVAVLNNTMAQLYVDKQLEVEANITELTNINSQVPISIGANIGLISFDSLTIDNFNGRIKEVKIYY